MYINGSGRIKPLCGLSIEDLCFILFCSKGMLGKQTCKCVSGAYLCIYTQGEMRKQSGDKGEGRRRTAAGSSANETPSARGTSAEMRML